jgi:hypothetical protein
MEGYSGAGGKSAAHDTQGAGIGRLSQSAPSRTPTGARAGSTLGARRGEAVRAQRNALALERAREQDAPALLFDRLRERAGQGIRPREGGRTW